MKATQKYNKSLIMTRAWYFYKHRDCCTFSECLKEAWEMAKRGVAEREKREAEWAEYYRKHGARDDYYSNLYRGKNDWQVSYGRGYRAGVYCR